MKIVIDPQDTSLHRYVEQLPDMPCRPWSIFGNKPCYRGDYACMHHLVVDKIYRRIEEILQQEKP